MSKASATLGGRDLIITDEGISWTLKAGYFPNIQNFVMAPADALAIAGKNKPIQLIITPDNGTPLVVEHLWALKILPGPNPYLSRVMVADRRWFWDRIHVIGNYNCRRNVGIKRILTNDAQIAVDFDRAFEVAYWRWSLINGVTKYQPLSMLKDVLSKVSKAEKDYWGQTFESILDDRLGTKIQGLPIEDLKLDANGRDAMMQAVEYLPEAAVTVDYDGKVIVFSRASGDEINLVKATVPELWGKGHTDLVKNSQERPREVHVLFTREVETRFDFAETAAATTGTQTADLEPMGNRRLMQNVVMLPDYATDGLSNRPSQINGQTFVQGTWLNIDDYLRALPDLPIAGVSGKLDHPLIQRAFIPEMDLWSLIGLAGDLSYEDGTLSPWPARLAAIQNCYRRIFQLNRLWMDRFLSFRAYRFATINPQTGQRSPTMAYGDYAIVPSQRAKWRSAADGKDLNYAINRSAYPTGDLGILDSTALPSPGVVTVLDMDQGIVDVDYQIDLNRSYEKVLPSLMVTSSMPTANLRQGSRPIAFNEIINSADPPRLSPSFKLAFIVSAIPASPNSAQQLHRIVVKPNEIADLIPDAAKKGLSEANGPIMEIRIGPGIEVARIRWLDTEAQTIEHIFGIDTTTGQDWIVPEDQAAQEAFSKKVSSLCINEGSTAGRAGASLNQIARARAAAVYASFVDRFEGEATGNMNPNIHLNGWASEITHIYGSKSETFTRISFPSTIPQMSLHSFLSASERAVVMKLAQP